MIARQATHEPSVKRNNVSSNVESDIVIIAPSDKSPISSAVRVLDRDATCCANGTSYDKVKTGGGNSGRGGGRSQLLQSLLFLGSLGF